MLKPEVIVADGGPSGKLWNWVALVAEPVADRGPRAGNPRGVVDATGCEVQPAPWNFPGERLFDDVECLDPVATAPGSVTTRPR